MNILIKKLNELQDEMIKLDINVKQRYIRKAFEDMCSVILYESKGVDDKPDTFEPTKSYLLEHKDEYVADFGEHGVLRKCNKMPQWDKLNEDLTSNDKDDKMPVVAIYRKVWERDTRRELTIAEIEKEFNIKVKRESESKCQYMSV